MELFLDEIITEIDKEPDDWYHFTCKDIIMLYFLKATTVKMLKESIPMDEWRFLEKYHPIFYKHIKKNRINKIDELI